jgi:hypothetical protein
MGRVKKYHSEVERIDAKKAQWRTYYEKNKEKINANRMEKYYERKEKSD